MWLSPSFLQRVPYSNTSRLGIAYLVRWASLSRSTQVDLPRSKSIGQIDLTRLIRQTQNPTWTDRVLGIAHLERRVVGNAYLDRWSSLPKQIG